MQPVHALSGVPVTELRYSQPCAMTGCNHRVKHDHFCDDCHMHWKLMLLEPWADGMREIADEQARLMRRKVGREWPEDPSFGLPRQSH